MVIYGVALLSSCTLLGLVIGGWLGALIGVEANVGGVGIAMLLLIVLHHYSGNRVRIDAMTGTGITFWSAMYIPIVVAMAARQNVASAVSGGAVAVLAGTLAVAVSFALIPWMTRLARRGHPEAPERVDP